MLEQKGIYEYLWYPYFIKFYNIVCIKKIFKKSRAIYPHRLLLRPPLGTGGIIIRFRLLPPCARLCLPEPSLGGKNLFNNHGKTVDVAAPVKLPAIAFANFPVP